ncbi:MAG: molybdopterin molybdotransferase MoeA [Bacteroidetes bacterium]|nr:molybdopterin molybdotransferase MoeA [Bacteroidota bacterium]MBU1719518.1 molybdopterin molybdotransferase MoeA [Bacteroidota bacterium]
MKTERIEKMGREMIHFEKALEIVLQHAVTMETERVSLENSDNRILATDIHSDIDMPPFHKSAMDGFACRLEDLKLELSVIEDIPAGHIPEKNVSQGFCSRIMTGAMLPDGADCVIQDEEVDFTVDQKVRFVGTRKPYNICQKGEDMKVGGLVLQKGTLIHPAHIAVLASVGAATPEVYAMPRIAVISTGNELVEPEHFPPKGKIRNSNAMQILAQAKRLGCDAIYAGIAEDDPDATREIIASATSDADIVLLSGGVSMGDYDFVPAALEDCGYTIHFDSVAIQPGRPTVFATKPGKYCFGLPGNPVSSYVVFEIFVKPLIRKLTGGRVEEKGVFAMMKGDYKRRNTARKSFIPVQFSADGNVKTVDYHGSAHIHAITGADGLVAVEIGSSGIADGEKVYVRQI